MLVTTVLSTVSLFFGASVNASPVADSELQKRDAGVRYHFAIPYHDPLELIEQ
jgi:hypothetical protein